MCGSPTISRAGPARHASFVWRELVSAGRPRRPSVGAVLLSAHSPSSVHGRAALARRDHGEASSRPRDVPQAARHRDRAAVREVRRQVRDLRFVRATMHARAHLRRVQLRVLRGPLRDLRRRRHLGRVLLPRVHAAGEGSRRMPEDCEPRLVQDRPVLRTKKVRPPRAPTATAKARRARARTLNMPPSARAGTASRRDEVCRRAKATSIDLGGALLGSPVAPWRKQGRNYAAAYILAKGS